MRGLMGAGRYRSARGPASLVMSAAMSAGLIAATPGGVAVHGPRPSPASATPVPVSEVAPTRAGLPAMPAYHASVSWPAAGVAVADLTASGSGRARTAGPAPTRAGGLPVTVGRAVTGSASTTPAKVKVSLAPHATATAARVDGVVMGLTRADGIAAAGRVSVTVDYSSFAQAYGAGFASRLGLVELPACALTAPADPACQARTPLASTNDTAAGTVTADVALPATANAVLAVTSSPGGGGGDYAATSLKASGSWSEGGSAGAFTYQYPIATPPEPGGLSPEVTLAYDSQQVDGLTSATNNQPSWVGDGWDYSPGFVERSYPECLQVAPSADQTGDQCWSDTNQTVTLSLNGSATTLVDDPSAGWHPRNDDGVKVALLTGADNGDDNGAAAGEYWVITTTDGTKYYFGLNQLPGYASTDQATNSVDTAPVFSTASGQPCYDATFKSSYCAAMAYRWNLDYVVDAHGDAMAYYYSTETNHYGADKGAETLSYVRGSHLTKIAYGFRAGQAYSTSPKPAGLVSFSVNGRCDTSATGCDTSTLASSTASSWPDVPYDANCASSCTADTYWSPSFWSQYELTGVQTATLEGAAYKNVDAYALNHSFPSTGDASSPALWLSSITRTGQDAASSGAYIPMSPVTFTGSALANRVNLADGYDPLTRHRLTRIDTETGEEITVTYSAPGCASSTPSSPDTNTMLCYPQYWVPSGQSSPLLDWFNKYVVTSVTEQDTTGGGPPVQTSYTYPDPPAWHFDDNPATKAAYRTWDQWRGYGTVRTFTGTSPDPVTEKQDTYFRGMDGDRTASGGTASASVTDSRGESVADADQYAGMTRESITYDGSGGPAVSDTITDPWSQQTAAQPRTGADLPTLYAYQVGTAATRAYLPLASGGTRESRTSYTHDTYGRVTQTSSEPDVSNTALDTCTSTDYATNTSAWILDLTAETTVTSVPCSATPAYPADLVSQTLDFYDGSTADGAAPSAGDETMTEKTAVADSSGNPTSTVVSKNTVDEYGRVLTSTDGDGNVTKTAYTPATGAEPSAITVTDPMGHVTTTDYDQARNLATASTDAAGYTTTESYDALGRLVAVWKPGEPTDAAASVKYAYSKFGSGMSVVTTDTLGPQGTYRASETLYDALLRVRETQQATLDGGRDIGLTWYDSNGLEVKTAAPFYTTGAPDSSLVSVTDGQVPSETGYVHDGAGRTTRQISYNLANETWETDTSYQGADQTTATPPSGGTPTITVTDALGRAARLEQFNSATATGAPATATSYTYTPAGKPATITDAAGNTTSYTYDLLNRQLTQSDPDGGLSTSTYDGDGNLLSSTSSRGKVLSYVYDADDRRTAEYDTTGGAAQNPADEIASWLYDTRATGYPTSSTSYYDGAAFTDTTMGYNAFAEPTGDEVTVPDIAATDSGGATLAGNYVREFTYDTYAGLQLTETDQAAGGLAQETVATGYDAYGRPLNLVGTNSYISNLTYTEYDQPAQYTFGTTGNFAQLTLAYDEQTQALTNALTTTSTASIPADDTTYSYNDAQEVTQANDVQGETGSKVADNQCFAYNNLEQLTSAWTAASGSGSACGTTPTAANAASVIGGYEPYWQSWAYDTGGNRSDQTAHDVTGDTAHDIATTYSYPPAATSTDQPNTLSAATTTTGSPAGASTATYTYNTAGDTTAIDDASGTQTLTWTSDDKLASDTTSAGTTYYAYDAGGSLLMRQDPSRTTLFLPDEQLVLAGGAVSGTRYYSIGATQVAAGSSSGDVVYLIPDRQGSDVLQIDATSLAATRESYAPFGVSRGSAPSGWVGDTGYVGGTADSVTGLENLGAREYDPATGRFLSVDPVLESDSPQQMNGYDYAGNNPTTGADPSGLMLCNPGGGCGSLQYWESHGGGRTTGTGSNGGGTGPQPADYYSLDPYSWYAPGVSFPVRVLPKPRPPVKKPTVRSQADAATIPCNSVASRYTGAPCTPTHISDGGGDPFAAIGGFVEHHWRGIAQVGIIAAGVVATAGCAGITGGVGSGVCTAVVGAAVQEGIYRTSGGDHNLRGDVSSLGIGAGAALMQKGFGDALDAVGVGDLASGLFNYAIGGSIADTVYQDTVPDTQQSSRDLAVAIALGAIGNFPLQQVLELSR